jgi:hypothetical protein
MMDLRSCTSNHATHPLSQKCRQRKLAAIVAWDGRVRIKRLRHQRFSVRHAFEPQHLAGKQEGVTRRQHLEEILLHLAKLASWPHQPLVLGSLDERDHPH